MHKNAYRFYKMQPFFCFKHYFAVNYLPKHNRSPLRSQSAAHRPFTRKGQLSFRTVTSFLQDCFRQGRRQQRNRDKLVCFQPGAVVGLTIRQQQKSPSVREGRNVNYSSSLRNLSCIQSSTRLQILSRSSEVK